jgi:hypothetical protein
VCLESSRRGKAHRVHQCVRLPNLLFGDESMAWMDDESQRLTSLLSETSGYRLAATGGEAVSDIVGTVPNADWDRLVSEFLV